jgi:hypothetical protein
MATYDYTPGLGHAASYQVSGKPYLTGSINGKSHVLAGEPFEISFPNVTSEITIGNSDGSDDDMQWAISANGFATGNSFTQMAGGVATYRIKCTSIFVTGSDNINVCAALTGIPAGALPDNWTGSAGVG